jgi:tetratricopeptide (TPR) repeat protein
LAPAFSRPNVNADAARKAIALSQSIGDVEGEATGYYQLGRAFWRKDQVEARRQSERALTLARSAGSLQIEARILLVLGNLAYGQGNYPEARAYFDQVLRLRQTLGDRQGEAMALNNLGTVAVAQGDYTAAKNYFEPGLEPEPRN